MELENPFMIPFKIFSVIVIALLAILIYKDISKKSNNNENNNTLDHEANNQFNFDSTSNPSSASYPKRSNFENGENVNYSELDIKINTSGIDIYSLAMDYDPYSIQDITTCDQILFSQDGDITNDNNILAPVDSYNLGNTCYINSGLQSLFNCRSFTAKFLEFRTPFEKAYEAGAVEIEEKFRQSIRVMIEIKTY